MKVIIVGGSIAGLMHGIMFKHHGHEVQILERVGRDLEQHGTGISSTSELRAFLDLHDRVKTPFMLKNSGVRTFKGKSRPSHTNTKAASSICSWNALYYRLRANFDGLATRHCPVPPKTSLNDGSAVYRMGKEVTRVESQGAHQQVIVEYKDLDSGLPGKPILADLVLGADGAASTVRRLISPRAPQRRYAGYVAWRGVVPEASVSAATRQRLSNWITYHTASREYAVVYHIPGRDGSLREGERSLSFVWYTWQTAQELQDILTDREGHTHLWEVPAATLRGDVWERQRVFGTNIFANSCAELIDLVKTPSVQAVSDCPAPNSPGPSFSGGRIMLVGDAQCTLRPHTDAAVDQAARHCRELEKRIAHVEGAMSDNPQLLDLKAVESWNLAVLESGEVARLDSIYVGMRYLKSGMGRISSGFNWRHARFMIKWRKWLKALILGGD